MALRSFDGFGQFSAFLAQRAVIHEPLVEIATGVSVDAVYESVRTVMGDNTKLAHLADATQASRVAAGFTPDDPLVASGEMRDEIEKVHAGMAGGVGTNDIKQLWHEFGYMNARTGKSVPPRPAFLIGKEEAAPVILESIELALKETFGV